jgi:hypothetical protein
LGTISSFVGFEVLSAVLMKRSVLISAFAYTWKETKKTCVEMDAH